MKQEALTFIGTHTQTSQRYANYITRHTHTRDTNRWTEADQYQEMNRGRETERNCKEMRKDECR